jgi:putative hydroxymethylpyrimidine transport system substrate-binding protein
VTPVDQLGVPTYDELVVVAKDSAVEDNSEVIRLFLAALARGTAAAVSHPNQATKALLAANPDLDRKTTAAQVKATLPALSQPAASGHPWGYMDPAQWKEFIGWMRDNGLISTLFAPSAVLSEALLPGKIPD